jgi:hypothetical protein
MTCRDELVLNKGITAVLEETEPEEVEETETANPWGTPLTILCARDADDEDEDFDDEEEDLDYFYDDDEDDDFDDEFDDDLEEEELEEEEDEEA